jgi:hypothetical protein
MKPFQRAIALPVNPANNPGLLKDGMSRLNINGHVYLLYETQEE